MKKLRTINDIRKAFETATSGVADDTVFMAKAMMWMCEQMAARDVTAVDMLQVVVRELRELRREMAAKRTVEVTLADRIGVVENAINLRDLAGQLAEKARELEGMTSPSREKAT